MESKGIGTHIKNKKSIHDSLVTYYANCPLEPKYHIPVQIFVGNPQSYNRKIIDEPLAKTFIKTNDIHLYIHSAYVINLAKISEPSYNCLLKDIISAHNISSKGVVVHVGKYTDFSIEDSLKNMKTNILNILQYIIDNKLDTKLILETPSGQGTELLTKMDDFFDFCKDIVDSHLNSSAFGICIDTCHVFASGYNPDIYIKKGIESGLVSLIHFNDSKECKGSKKDRHAFYGSGKIPIDILDECICICKDNKYDMVIE